MRSGIIPDLIFFAGSDEIKYIYSANGEKLASVVGSSSTYYRSVMTYAKSGTGAEQILYIMHPEGLVAKESSAWVYKYFKTDHLGSTRALLAARGTSLTKEQSTDFYPFGLAHSTNNLHLNRYLFSGKEIQDVSLNGAILGLYDFHARYYNPMLGRWFNIDPALQLANPYLYCANNPMFYADPDGQFFFAALGIAALVKAICVGAAIGAATYTASVAMSKGGFDNWNWGQFGKSAGFGALGGAATFGVGQVFGPAGTFMNEVGRGAAHGLVQGGMGAMQGGDFWSSAAAGALGSWAATGVGLTNFGKTAAGQLGFSALAGGVGAAATGGNFWQGAGSGLMVAGLNHLKHKIEKPAFFRRLERHYRKGGGTDFHLTKKEFEYLTKKGIITLNQPDTGTPGIIYDAPINFYESDPDLRFSFGKATVYYQILESGQMIYTGFSDFYDFDPKPWGIRSTANEIITRTYGTVFSGTPFKISY